MAQAEQYNKTVDQIQHQKDLEVFELAWRNSQNLDSGNRDDTTGLSYDLEYQIL